MTITLLSQLEDRGKMYLRRLKVYLNDMLEYCSINIKKKIRHNTLTEEDRDTELNLLQKIRDIVETLLDNFSHYESCFNDLDDDNDVVNPNTNTKLLLLVLELGDTNEMLDYYTEYINKLGNLRANEGLKKAYINSKKIVNDNDIYKHINSYESIINEPFLFTDITKSLVNVDDINRNLNK